MRRDDWHVERERRLATLPRTLQVPEKEREQFSPAERLEAVERDHYIQMLKERERAAIREAHSWSVLSLGQQQVVSAAERRVAAERVGQRPSGTIAAAFTGAWALVLVALGLLVVAAAVTEIYSGQSFLIGAVALLAFAGIAWAIFMNP